jgi:hypothetical protein
MDYEVLFYNGWIEPPAYYLIASATGDTPEQALQRNLAELTRQVRKTFGLNSNDIPDARLQETIYLLRENGLISPRDIQLGTSQHQNRGATSK